MASTRTHVGGHRREGYACFPITPKRVTALINRSWGNTLVKDQVFCRFKFPSMLVVVCMFLALMRALAQTVVTLAGGNSSGTTGGTTDGVGTAAFNSPVGVTVDTAGNVIVADQHQQPQNPPHLPFHLLPWHLRQLHLSQLYSLPPRLIQSHLNGLIVLSPLATPPARSAQVATTAPRALPRGRASTAGAATTAPTAPPSPFHAPLRLCLCPTPPGCRTH
jgi:hypothetical protein